MGAVAIGVNVSVGGVAAMMVIALADPAWV